MREKQLKTRLSFVIITALLACQCVITKAGNLWSGATVMPGSWGSYQKIEASSFEDVQVGDFLELSLTDVSKAETQWPQVQLNNGSFAKLKGAGNIPLSEGDTKAKYGITQQMLSEMQSGGIVVTGAGYTLTSIDIVTGDREQDYRNAVWIGETVMNSEWTNYVSIPAECFENAHEGELLRMKIKDLKAAATGRLSNPQGWGAMDGADDYPSLAGAYYEYTISATMLSQLQSNGLIVGGCNYTLTAVEVINSENIVDFSTSITIHDTDWTWYGEDKPSLDVNIGNPEATAQTSIVAVEVTTDKMEKVCRLTQTIELAANSTGTASFTLNEITAPGFYRVTVTVNDAIVTTTIANGEEVSSFNIGYEPNAIISAPDAQPDFKEYWDAALAQLADVPINATLTEIPEKSSDSRKVYLVEMQSIANGTSGEPVIIRGYYAEPTGEGPYPAIIYYQGYDSDGVSDPWCPNGADNPGCIELVLSPRGQWINNREPYQDSNIYGYWFTYEFGNKDAYYYRGAYMDQVRGIDFICSREKVKQDNIFATGGSQGGAFTIAAAALDNRLRAIAPAIQFMGDFPDYFKVGNWPVNYAEAAAAGKGMSEEEMYAFLSYYDTKNFAPYITCPVLTTIGLQDNVCPPHTNMAPYNNLTQVAEADKKYVIAPRLRHATPSNWSALCSEWWNKYSVGQSSGKVEKRTNLYTGETVCADDWSAGWQKFAASYFSNCKAGDKVVVTVSEVSPTCANPMVYLQDGKWSNFNPNMSSAVSEPGEVVFTLTNDIINTIMDTGALIVKGCGYTFTSVDLLCYVSDGTESTKDITVILPIWRCHTTCPDNWGNSEYIPAEKFAMVTQGAALKVHVTEKSPTAQWPQVRLNTKGYAKMSESVAVSEVDRDYTLLIPDNMIDEIKANGVRVSGGGYTFDLVTLETTVAIPVEPSAEDTPQLYADYDNLGIREFKSGEQPGLDFTFINPEETDLEANLKVVLTTDTGNELKTYEQVVTATAGDGEKATLTHSSVDLSEEVTAPGVYHFKATYNGKTFCSYNIAYRLEDIDCPSDAKDDFEQFWSDALQELAAVAPEYTIEEYTAGKSDSDTRTIYKVTMKSTPNILGETPVTVGGYLAVPMGEENLQHPVLVKFQGTDGGTGTVTVPSRKDTSGWCEFIFSTRGQMLNREDQPIYYPEGSNSPDYYAYGLGDFHQHYYYGAHLDCVRAIDFVAQYPGVNPKNIFAMGGSQGGAFTYVTAALDHRVKAIAPSITGHADFRHNCERVGWPLNVFTNFLSTHADWDWERLFDFLTYFDVKNFSKMIQCPVITNFSLQDTTDPTHCNIVPYLLLTNVDAADKEYSLNNFLNHATAPNFTTTAMDFFGKYLSENTETSIIQIGVPKSERSIYNLCGQRLNDCSSPGIYIINGKKYVIGSAGLK